MHRILDYAGMFPPAKLTLEDALRNFREYQRHKHAGFLGRFVMPAFPWTDQAPRELTLIVRADQINQDLRTVAADSIEVAWTDCGLFSDFLTLLEESFPGRIFVELNWRKPYDILMAMLAEKRRFGVKLRTGGVTPEAIPPSRAIADFLLAAANHRLPMKATAGLHVPVPNDDPDVGARMHGFFNFFCAGFLAYSGRGDRESVTNVLENFSYEDFSFGEQSMRCGTVEFSKHEIEHLRSRWLLSFGSCSFLEPVEHLERHGLI
jgi:hypothetical protein